jgi:hypothetical protein
VAVAALLLFIFLYMGLLSALGEAQFDGRWYLAQAKHYHARLPVQHGRSDPNRRAGIPSYHQILLTGVTTAFDLRTGSSSLVQTCSLSPWSYVCDTTSAAA